jgi:hypothetical protein
MEYEWNTNIGLKISCLVQKLLTILDLQLIGAHIINTELELYYYNLTLTKFQQIYFSFPNIIFIIKSVNL